MIDPAWVALSLCKHLGGKTFRTLLTDFNDDLDAILQADAPRLRQVRGIGAKIAQSIQAIDLHQTEAAILAWQDAGIDILTTDDTAYPSLLKALDDAPPTLFIRGRTPPPSTEPTCAIVGTRRPSPESARLAQQISMELAQHGLHIISGLASGVDTTAHMGALAVPGGHTWAVLGSGVLNIYPPENHALAQAIQERGGLLCEVAPDMSVAAPGLVARNRIITGLSDAVIIIETAVDGGAMHAARFATMQGKPIYAVDNAASGNRQLIDAGAVPIRNGDVSHLLEQLQDLHNIR